MTAIAIIRRAREIGLTLEPQGNDCLMVRGLSANLDAMKADIIANKSAIIALLGERQVRLASDAVRAAEQILRDIAPRKPRRQRRQRQP